MDDEKCLLPAVQLAAMIRRGEFTSVELVEATLARIKRLNPALNAVCTVAEGEALDVAARADEQTATALPLGPLHGLPFTVKDSFSTNGIRSTGGAMELADHVPIRDAPAVAALRAAGAIVIGKTNVPEWGADMQTHNQVFGLTNNPWDLARTVGGSSGGSAAAAAAGLAAFDLADDLGGSNALTSSFCGVYGHRPTHGIVSTLGLLDSAIGASMAESSACAIGSIARDAGDLELVFDCLLAASAQPSPYWTLQLPANDALDGVRGLRVGTLFEDRAIATDAGTSAMFEELTRAIEREGGVVEHDARPFERLGAWLRLAIVRAVTANPATVPGFNTHEAVAAAAGVTRSDPKYRPLLHREWHQAERAIAGMRAAWLDLFTRIDVLICPAAPCTAFPHTLTGSLLERTYQVGDDEWGVADVGGWLALIAATNLPAVTVPIGLAPDGLPVGVQVVAPPFHDRRAFAVAAAIGRLSGGYRVPALAERVIAASADFTSPGRPIPADAAARRRSWSRCHGRAG